MRAQQKILVLLGLVLGPFEVAGCGGRTTEWEAGPEEKPLGDDVRLPSGEVGDPGWKGIHRLNAREYNNTIRDLLGSTLDPAAGFLEETEYGFDNIASSKEMRFEQFASYLEAAEAVAADVFAHADLKKRVLICDSMVADADCAQQIIHDFGRRAFRRPLTHDEVSSFLGVYARAVGLGLNHSDSVQQVVVAFLIAPQFLYRMEFDEDPNFGAPHLLSQYELASRLSYFLWSTQPDQELMNLADSGSLQGEELNRIIEKMLSDPRSDALVDAFAWQWLGFTRFEEHAVDQQVFPEWNEDLRTKMLVEARAYANQFIRGGALWGDFLTAELALGNLSAFYGALPEGRVGFLGLGAFLTSTSLAERTSPTSRGRWILENLLCDPPAPPPTEVPIPDLDSESTPQAPPENIRGRLEEVVSGPACAVCHEVIDPFGLALENYDPIGRYRGTYSNGDVVNAQVTLPNGLAVEGLATLAQAINQDERFIECTIKKTFVYGLGRVVTPEDEVHLASIRNEWGGAESTFTELLKQLIQSVPFQQRRGEQN